MPTKLRLALSVVLILCVAAGAGGGAAINLHELLDGLRRGAPRLMAGTGMFYGFIVAVSLVLMAGLIIEGDLVGRAPTQALFTATKWILGGTVALLILGPVLGEAFVNDQLHRAGYAPCPTAWRPLSFARTEWVLPGQPCTPPADR
ncbi:MAG TPA: hypothetical protein VKC66_31315 [Xanthobacteraceae bacterium]|nr:hypothetical protein [Xanthobacteraceae bacterium]